jgi:hypothetical protein
MSLANITIEDEKIETKSGTKNGKDWEIREQAATIETPHMRMPVRLSLAKGASAYRRGRYTFDVLKSLRVSDFGTIQLARNLPLEAAK